MNPESPGLLTIAIPTFDRNEQLARTVAALLPQLRPGVQLVIRDNASPVPVASTLEALIAGRSDVCVVRNVCNIGGGANVLRCLEACETEWLWILGDDDTPIPGAVTCILADINAADAGLVGVNYRCELYDRREARELRGVDDFLARADSLSNLLLLSATVVRAPRLKPQLRLAYAYMSSWISHLAALLFSLGEDGRVRLSMERIVRWEPPDLAASWSIIGAALAFSTAADLPLTQRQRGMLMARMESDIQPELLGLARQLLASACEAGDGAGARWTWRQIRYRRFGGRLRSVRAWLAWGLGGLFVAPRLTRPLVEAVARWHLGDRAGRNVLQDPMKRI